MLSNNIPASVFNVLVAAFFAVVLLGVVLGAYAAIQLRKCQEQLRLLQQADVEPKVSSTPVATGTPKPEA